MRRCAAVCAIGMCLLLASSADAAVGYRFLKATPTFDGAELRFLFHMGDGRGGDRPGKITLTLERQSGTPITLRSIDSPPNEVEMDIPLDYDKLGIKPGDHITAITGAWVGGHSWGSADRPWGKAFTLPAALPRIAPVNVALARAEAIKARLAPRIAAAPARAEPAITNQAARKPAPLKPVVANPPRRAPVVEHPPATQPLMSASNVGSGSALAAVLAIQRRVQQLPAAPSKRR